jgi:peptide/nickel transport system permease protein
VSVLVRRAPAAALRLLVVSLILFAVLHVPRGGPADILAADPAASPEAIARIKALWGVDRPVHVQYAVWLRRVLTGD